MTNQIFSATSDWVPHYGDEDWPPWLAQEMDKHVPSEILERYATYKESVFNGPFYKIDPKYRDAILKDLRKFGFTVDERKDLELW